MLKAALHNHSSEDENETIRISYSAKDLIDHAAKQGFEIVSFTFHNRLYFPRELMEYAAKKDILLIQGIEKKIEEKEVLLYNFTRQELAGIKKISDLRAYSKKKDKLVIAPHPFFLKKQCLGKKLVKNISVFHAIEWSHFYNRLVNRNLIAQKVADKHKKPIIGNPDTHMLWQLRYTYCMIDSKKDIISVFEAIKKNRMMTVTRPLPPYRFIQILLRGIHATVLSSIGKQRPAKR